MAKPVIAVDVDEVLSPYLLGLVAWHNNEYGTQYTFQDFYSYEFYKVWGGTREEAIVKGGLYFQSRGPVVPLADSVRVLNRLKQDFTLIVVTSRPLIHKSQTETWIREHFGHIFAEILLCNHWRLDDTSPVMKKSEACALHGAEYLIDDFPHYVEEVAHAGITGLLFGDYPWNQQVQNHPQIQRVSHWQAVENYFYR